jgi:hypothetical protein
MRQQPDHILEDTMITLADGKQFRMRYERERHTVTCDLCLINIRLPVTANPYALESHCKACRHRQQKKQAATKFHVLDIAPEVEGSFNLPLLSARHLQSILMAGPWLNALANGYSGPLGLFGRPIPFVSTKPKMLAGRQLALMMPITG